MVSQFRFHITLLFVSVLSLGFLPGLANAVPFADIIKTGSTLNLSKSQTYTGGAFIGKSMVINGNGAKIQLSGSEMISIGGGSTVVFNNLTVTGGKGIYVNSSNNRFTGNSIIISNSISNGLLANGATIALYNSRVENVRSPSTTGIAYGLSIQNCKNLIVKNCTIQYCDMSIYLYNSTGARIENTTVKDGKRSDGILIHSNSSATVLNTSVSGCKSGLAITGGSTVWADKCNLSWNVVDPGSKIKGQGIYVMKGSGASITNTTIQNNANEGIYCSDSAVYIEACYIANNGWNAKDGNGVNLDNTPAHVLDCRMSGNYLFGVQVNGHDALVRGCEIRKNRLGGIRVTANATGRKQEFYGNICDANTYQGADEYELNCDNSMTRITANNNIFSSNPGIGAFFQSGSYGDLTGNIIYANGGNNMNVYKANASLKRSVVANSPKGMFLNTAPSSSIHENDILDCEMGADIMPDTGTTTDFTQNWWGSATGPYVAQRNPSGGGTKASWNIINFKPWKTSPVTYYLVSRYFAFTPGATKTLSNSSTLPFAKFHINSPTSDESQFLAAQASNSNLFPQLPINVSLPSKVLYMWVNANRGIRIKSSWTQIELNTAGGVLSNLANTKVMKYNNGTGRWDTLTTKYNSSSNSLKVDQKDIQGCYLVFAGN